MKRDKAALQYDGKTQLDRAFELASRHLEQVFVSVRAAQIDDPDRARYPLIVDSVAGEGPIVGIRSALAAHPDAAWLVLACDLPFLSDAALEQLLAERDPALERHRLSQHARRSAGTVVRRVGTQGRGRARRLSGRRRKMPAQISDPPCRRLLEPNDRRALDNVNTPEEYAQALEVLGARKPHDNPMQLKIQYYALMREQAGRSEETLETRARHAGGSVRRTAGALRLHAVARAIESRGQQ